MFNNLFLAIIFLVLAFGVSAQVKPATAKTPMPRKVVLTDGEITSGLKDALFNGVTSAVKNLGKPGGYFNNLRVKIPMPKHLQSVEKSLRFLRQGKLADDFVKSMNNAAEKAVPVAVDIFADSVKQMTFTDAKNILTGPPDSATQYFRKTSEEKLREKFLPLVKTATEEVGVTAKYKSMMNKGGKYLAVVGGQKDFDLDQYVTQKALDGLFLLIADEEKRIRENPVARTTSILKKVFGSIFK
jgi:hypothetical protein